MIKTTYTSISEFLLFKVGRYNQSYRFSTIQIMGSMSVERRMKADSVAIIGAGPSGLAAAK
jgi:NADPH-dependent glutamate synthase beta subunit-like oxidoreductase